MKAETMTEQKPNDTRTGVQEHLGALPPLLQRRANKRNFTFPAEDFRDATCFTTGEPKETRILYVMGKGDVWKVGMTRNLENRFLVVQAEASEEIEIAGYRVIPATGCGLVERYAHATLNDKQVHGEWFQCELAEALAAVDAAVEYSSRAIMAMKTKRKIDIERKHRKDRAERTRENYRQWKNSKGYQQYLVPVDFEG